MSIKQMLYVGFTSFLTCLPICSAQTIRAKGSDTLKPLAERWAQIYERKNTGVHLEVSGGSSGPGIAALLKGDTDIAEASRPLNDSEKEEFRKARKTPVDVVVALDAVEILVNPANTIDSLSMEEVKGIFSGTITNWNQVGGFNRTINLYGRDSSSGTRAFLQEYVLHGNPYAPGVTEFPAYAPLIAAVTKDKDGICYAGLGAGRGLKHLSIRIVTDGKGIEPSAQNIKSARYPLSRELHWFLLSHPTGHLRELCLWVLSSEAQEIVEKEGFIPISAETRRSILAGL